MSGTRKRLRGRLARFLLWTAERVPFAVWLKLSAACGRIEGWLK